MASEGGGRKRIKDARQSEGLVEPDLSGGHVDTKPPYRGCLREDQDCPTSGIHFNYFGRRAVCPR